MKIAIFQLKGKKDLLTVLSEVKSGAAAVAVQQWLVQLKGHQQWNQGDTGSS